MKHLTFLAAALAVASLAGAPDAQAQNIQLHYDFGSALYAGDYGARPRLTSTVELFRPDAWGTTFLFVDMDYTNDGITGGYWEIAREFQYRATPFSLHAEYNGGLTSSYPFQNAYLGGATYAYVPAAGSGTFAVSLLYKYIQRHATPHNFQLTGTWEADFGPGGLLTFAGFADWWREKTGAGEYIFMAEPQLWLNLNRLRGVRDDLNLSLGGEAELTRNFALRKGWYCIPTLGLKWTFR
jgi:hypothetical protein